MDQITLSDFRCFREKQTARLAPLTLLVGENSTGKTSFLALVRALWNIGYQQRIPDFKEDPYDLGSFDEIAHHRGARGGRANTFEAGFSARIGRRHDMRPEGAYLFSVTFHRHRTGTTPRKIRVEREKRWIEFDFPKNDSVQTRVGTPRGVWQRSMPEEFSSIVEVDRRLFVLFPGLWKEAGAEWTSLKGLTPLPSDEDLKEIETLLRRIRGDFFTFQSSPYASAPVRSKPRRTYDPARPVRDPEGDYTPMYVAEMSFRNTREWATLQGALEAFGKEAGLFDEISVRLLGKKENEPFQIQVRKFGRKSKGPPRNLIDVGYGISQILPVITELLREDTAPLFLLQQPEVHLHPSAQAALGSLFCEVAGWERQLVVETHSDHLLDRVRMDVRDGRTKLKPEEVSILYFERGDLDVHIHSLRLDKEGNTLDAPPSYRQFFTEETNRSIGI